jgi:hypothetical protein
VQKAALSAAKARPSACLTCVASKSFNPLNP